MSTRPGTPPVTDGADRPPRVAVVGPTHPAPGGIVHFTDGLARALTARGPEPLIVGWRRRFPARLYPGTIDDTASTVAISARGEPLLDLLDPRTWRRAARRITAAQTDIALLQWWHPMHAPVVIALRRALRRAGVRVIVVCHNLEPHESNAAWRALTRRALRRVDAVVIHASALRDDARRMAPGVPVIEAYLPVFDNVAAQAGPADADAIARTRARYGATGGRRMLLCFGYVRPYKGVEDAVAAMEYVTGDAVLVVAGECWDGRDALERQAANAGDRVRLDLRYIPNDELPALFGAADAVVVPYREATQSAVAALAIAYGTPVVATDVGGLAELVTPGTGRLAPARDPVALAAAIDAVLADRRDWGPGMAAARDRLSWDRYVDLILSPPAPARDAATHAVLDTASRGQKAAKIIDILARERDLAGTRILDVGTGSGTIAARLAAAAGDAGRVSSADVADVRVERDGYAFTRYDGRTLPFADGAFDVVVSNHVLEHVGGRRAQRDHVDEIARVLAPGGIAYVAVPHRWQLVENHYRVPGLGWARGRVADLQMRIWRRGARYDCRPLGRRELTGLLRSAGLDARDLTAALVDATARRDHGPVAATLRRVPGIGRLIRGPLLPTIVAIGTRRGANG